VRVWVSPVTAAATRRTPTLRRGLQLVVA
jgi:hypothetical protein